MSHLKRNLGYQTVYQILNTCLPLITAPYLSRCLGAEKLGVYTYVNSISGYFVLFAMLGIVNYGTRCIAEAQNQAADRNRIFCEIFCVQLLSAGAAALGYGGFLLLYGGDQGQIFLIQGIAVLACLLDISWYFFGMEDFRFIVLRSAVLRVSSVALILLLVKRPEDLWIYALIMAGCTLLNDLILWPRALGRLRPVRPARASVRRHLRPILLLFFPLLALSVYHLMDKTMLGLLCPYAQSGYYNNADKLINIPVGILTGIGAVMLPRISALVTEKREDEAASLLLVSLEGILAAAWAIAFGISAISAEFVPLFFGPGYDPCIRLTVVLSPVLLFKSVSLLIRNGYLIPHYHDRQYIHSVIFGAVINFAANLLLIPRYGALGASVGTILAEAGACLWQLVFVGRRLPLWRTLRKSAWYPVFGALMLLCVRCVSRLATGSAVRTVLLEVLVGAATYGGLCLLYWRLSRSPVFSALASGRRRTK